MEVLEGEVVALARLLGSVLGRTSGPVTGTAPLQPVGPITLLAGQTASSVVPPRMNLLAVDMKVTT